MIQFRVISGKMAGDIKVVRHFPFHVGRLAENHLFLDEPGVWDHHITVEFLKTEGFILGAAPDAFTAVNDTPQVTTRLRNGDIITCGSAKIQFWLAPPTQHGLNARELSVWLLIAGVTALQITLLWLLTK